MIKSGLEFVVFGLAPGLEVFILGATDVFVHRL